MFPVSESELNRLMVAGDTASVYQVAFGVSVGAIISLGTVFLTVTIEGLPLSVATGLFWASVLCALTFGFLWLRSRASAKEMVDEIKESTLKPWLDP